MDDKNKKCYNVVAAVIVENDKYLCFQKGATKYDYTSYKYEFPGGKIENGETPHEALKREIFEELSCEVEVMEDITKIKHRYPDFDIVMTAFLCTPISMNYILKEHIAAIRKPLNELLALDWAAADLKIVTALIEKFDVQKKCGESHT